MMVPLDIKKPITSNTMHWYLPIEQKILTWRGFRQSLQTEQNLSESLLQIQQWWLTAPIRRVSLLNDDHARWPSPWQLFDNLSYCDLSRCLGMFYTCALCPEIKQHPITLRILYSAEGERVSIVDVDDGKYILNFNEQKLVNTSSISSEYQSAVVFVPQDFRTLE